MIGTGICGLTPRLGDAFLSSVSTLKTCTMLTNIVDSYGVLVAGSSSRSIAALGAGQVDRFGSTNSTIMPGDVYLTGSGGGNGAANAREVIIVQAASRERMVPRVHYVTSPGTNVRTLVTDLGIFQKLDGDELVLTGYLDDESRAEAEIVAEIKRGWEVVAAPRLNEIAPPTTDEILMLRLMDPERAFTK